MECSVSRRRHRHRRGPADAYRATASRRCRFCGLKKSLGQILVECRAAWSVAPGQAVFDQFRAISGEITGVEKHGHDRRRPFGNLLQQSPISQAPRSVPMNEVTVRDVGRKADPVDQQDPHTLPCEEHRQGRSGAAAPDDDHIVHVGSP